MNTGQAHIIVETKKSDDSPRRRWRLRLPEVSQHDFYRQVCSFNAFFCGLKGRNWKNGIYRGVGIIPAGDWTLYNQAHESDYNITKLPDIDLPIVDVDGIWEFYKIIGFDYKTKKYL
jgi:hypothetical protein